MEASGDTALFDALALAKDQLVEKGKQYQAAAKRCVVISDGLDTSSVTNTAADITWRLREAGIVVDSVSLGDTYDTNLRTISYVTVSTDSCFCECASLTYLGWLSLSSYYTDERTCDLRARAIPLFD